MLDKYLQGLGITEDKLLTTRKQDIVILRYIIINELLKVYPRREVAQAMHIGRSNTYNCEKQYRNLERTNNKIFNNLSKKIKNIL